MFKNNNTYKYTERITKVGLLVTILWCKGSLCYNKIRVSFFKITYLYEVKVPLIK